MVHGREKNTDIGSTDDGGFTVVASFFIGVAFSEIYPFLAYENIIFWYNMPFRG